MVLWQGGKVAGPPAPVVTSLWPWLAAAWPRAGRQLLAISQLFSLEARQDLAVMQPVRNLQSILHNPPITILIDRAQILLHFTLHFNAGTLFYKDVQF